MTAPLPATMNYTHASNKQTSHPRNTPNEHINMGLVTPVPTPTPTPTQTTADVGAGVVCECAYTGRRSVDPHVEQAGGSSEIGMDMARAELNRTELRGGNERLSASCS